MSNPNRTPSGSSPPALTGGQPVAEAQRQAQQGVQQPEPGGRGQQPPSPRRRRRRPPPQLLPAPQRRGRPGTRRPPPAPGPCPRPGAAAVRHGRRHRGDAGKEAERGGGRPQSSALTARAPQHPAAQLRCQAGTPRPVRCPPHTHTHRARGRCSPPPPPLFPSAPAPPGPKMAAPRCLPSAKMAPAAPPARRPAGAPGILRAAPGRALRCRDGGSGGAGVGRREGGDGTGRGWMGQGVS